MKSTTNTPEVKQEIIETFEQSHGNHRLCLAFENGQWFASCLTCGDTWSVVDSDDGIDFEVIDSSEETCSKTLYSVIVGNIGTVCAVEALEEAERFFNTYKEQSESEVGRAGGEDVTMFRGEEIHKEFFGSIGLSDTE
jgi:hypothetical protein